MKNLLFLNQHWLNIAQSIDRGVKKKQQTCCRQVINDVRHDILIHSHWEQVSISFHLANLCLYIWCQKGTAPRNKGAEWLQSLVPGYCFKDLWCCQMQLSHNGSPRQRVALNTPLGPPASNWPPPTGSHLGPRHTKALYYRQVTGDLFRGHCICACWWWGREGLMASTAPSGADTGCKDLTCPCGGPLMRSD